MKRFLCLLACVILTLLPLHSGRTDANGGHYDRSTGEYHYHHGYPAHQHENGICPYENHETETPPVRSAPDAQGNRSVSEAPEASSVWTIIEIVFACLMVIYCIVWFIMFFFIAPRIRERQYRECQAKKYQPYLDRIHNKRK